MAVGDVVYLKDGRAFRGDEGGQGEAPVTVVNERLWRSRFGAAEELVGDEIVLDG